MISERFGGSVKTAPARAMIINNLGGMPAIEMSLVAKAILETDIGARTQFVIGPAPLMTALDMRGFSISVLVLDRDLTEALLAPTLAPACPGARSTAPVSRVDSTETTRTAAYAPSTNAQVRRGVETVSKAIIASEADLKLLDAKVGDGDTGTTMANAARAVLGTIDQLPLANPAQLCGALADTFAKGMGRSSGVLLSILASATGHALASGSPWGAALSVGLGRMEYYGGAREGDRTMLDALRPAPQP